MPRWIIKLTIDCEMPIEDLVTIINDWKTETNRHDDQATIYSVDIQVLDGGYGFDGVHTELYHTHTRLLPSSS